MSNEILNFNRLYEGYSSDNYIPKEDEERIRNTYKHEIGANDMSTPVVIYALEAKKEKLDKRWALEGRICVDRGFDDSDAYVYLVYDFKDMSVTVYPIFSDGERRINVHRRADSFTGNFFYNARIHHPYTEGPEIWATSNASNTKWVFYYSPYDGASGTAFAQSDLVVPQSLYKKLSNYEDEKDVLKHSRTDYT